MGKSDNENMEKVQAFVDDHEWDTLIGQVKSAIDTLQTTITNVTWIEKKRDWKLSRILNSFKDDKYLFEYAKLKLRDDKSLNFIDRINLIKYEVLSSRRHRNYFNEFKTFLERLKNWENISWDSKIHRLVEWNQWSLEDDQVDWENNNPDWNSNWHENVFQRWKKAKEVPNNKEKRMKWLFPEWTPKSPEEMKKYLTTIDVPVCTTEWKVARKKLNVHKKLSNEISEIFQEMCDIKFPIYSAWCYDWRYVVWSNTKKRSQHSYWSAVDINWGVNWWGKQNYWPDDPSSPYHITGDVVKIWERHWFNRWWRRRKKDPMHFSFVNW